MRTRSHLLVLCAVLALVLGTPLFAEEPPKKSQDDPDAKQEQKAEEADARGETPKREEAEPDPSAVRKAQQKVEKAKEGAEEPIVFTNKDLEALFGKSEPSAPPATAPVVVPTPGGGKPAAQTQAQARDEARIKQIQAEIERLTEMNRGLRNPYLKRVQPKDDEKKIYEDKGADERIRINEERIAELRKELAKLRARASSPPRR